MNAAARTRLAVRTSAVIVVTRLHRSCSDAPRKRCDRRKPLPICDRLIASAENETTRLKVAKSAGPSTRVVSGNVANTRTSCRMPGRKNNRNRRRTSRADMKEATLAGSVNGWASWQAEDAA